MRRKSRRTAGTCSPGRITCDGTTCIRTAYCQPAKPSVSWRRHCVHVSQRRFGGTSCGGFATSCCPSFRSSLGHTCPAQNQRCEPSAKHACFTDLSHHDQSKIANDCISTNCKKAQRQNCKGTSKKSGKHNFAFSWNLRGGAPTQGQMALLK